MIDKQTRREPVACLNTCGRQPKTFDTPVVADLALDQTAALEAGDDHVSVIAGGASYAAGESSK